VAALPALAFHMVRGYAYTMLTTTQNAKSERITTQATINRLEITARYWREYSPTVSASECVQRGLIESWKEGTPTERLSESDVAARACGWKKALLGRHSRQFADVAGIKYTDGTRSANSGADFDLAQEVPATAPIDVFGDEPEALAALAECLSADGKVRLARALDPVANGYNGGNSARLLREEVGNLTVLPEWRQRMHNLRVAWRRIGAARIAHAEAIRLGAAALASAR
jgi:hypothetical protein